MRPNSKATRPLVFPDSSNELEDKDINPLVFTTAHAKKPTRVDLSEFETGATSTSTRWTGDFRGRPELIRELAPHIRAVLLTSAETTTATFCSSLRAWWRLLDSVVDIAPVKTVVDLGYIHEAQQVRQNLNPTYTNNFLKVVNLRRLELGLHRLIWIKPQPSEKLTDLPEHWQVKLIYEELKNRAWKALHRLQNAELASGIDHIQQISRSRRPKSLSDGDARITYLSFASLMRHPCPSGTQLGEYLDVPKWFRVRCTQAIEQTYFCLDDLRAFFLLFLLLTGWNSGTAIDIDLDADPVIPHPTAAGLDIVRSYKARSNSEQVAICQAKRELGPSNLLRQLIGRTEPLRAHLRRQLAELPEDASHIDRATIERAIRSPWIYPIRDGVIQVLTVGDANRNPGRTTYLRDLIVQINGRSPTDRAIPINMKVADLRDAFISFAYRQSGYDWLIAKLAAGHKSLKSTRTYLNKTHWSRFGKSSVRKLTHALWAEIEDRKVVEPAFLFWLVQRGEISEEQRSRWLAHKDRTRVGVGCKSFRNPPRLIAPEHQAGRGCQAFRCTLCPNAVVFADSVKYLARRQAELLWAQKRIPLVSWEQSIFPEELRSLEATLDLFDAATVEDWLDHWNLEIEAKRHTPRIQEGEYD